MKILVVDDREGIRNKLQLLLESNGYQIACATDGVEALALAHKNPPNLVITDILLPELDGFTLCHDWQQDAHLRQIPLIFYTATFTDEKDRDFALSLGAARFIVKSDDPETLLQAIREVLQQVYTPVTPAVDVPMVEHTGLMKKYSESLVQRLKHNTQQLGECNRQLARDIAARKIAEEALKDQNERMQFIIDGAQLGTWSWNVQTNETIFNERWAEMLGYTIEELTPCNYDTWRRLVHPDDVDVALKLFEDAIVGRKSIFNCEFRMQHKKGHWVWMLDSGRVMTRDAAGKSLEMFGTHTDISELKQREDDVTLLGEMLDNAPASILIHDFEGNILFHNLAALAQHGYTAHEFAKINLHQLDVPESEALIEERFKLITEQGEATYEASHFRKDGSTFPSQVITKMIEWHGKPAVLNIATDVTERTQAQMALRESEENFRNFTEQIVDCLTSEHRGQFWSKS